MSDDMNITPKRPAAIYEPGELEHTRQNIGLLDPEEAQRMMKKLGGEIGIEKSMPFDEKSLPKNKRTYVRRTTGAGSGSSGSATGSAASHPSASDSSSSGSSTAAVAAQAHAKVDKGQTLPTIPAKTRQDMDEIMISYQIKERVGFITNLLNQMFNRTERVSEEFITGTLSIFVQRYTKFVVSVVKLIQDCPDAVREQLQTPSNTYQKTIVAISQFHTRELETMYQELLHAPQTVTIPQLIPFVKTFYSDIYTIWFLGQKQVSEYLKHLYDDALSNPGIKTELVQSTSRESITAWRYVSDQVCRGLYPLLMRMCCLDISPYPDILKTESQRILQFIGKTKYELLFPDKEPPKPTPEELAAQAEKEAEEEAPKMPPMVQRGLQVLDTMFPKAGWLDIANLPDLYPYFQGIYQFQDGLNYVHPKNPMQIAIILLRIIEDFFVACRYIPFRSDLALDFFSKNQTTKALFDEFAEYREVLFDRNYAPMMREFVNNIYANSEYQYSQFGKKESSNLYWYAHNHFFPYLRFDLTFIDKPKPDSTLPMLKEQLPSISRFFGTIINRADKAWSADPAEARTTEAIGAQKLWNPYHFPVPNAVSKRLDVLLGGKKSKTANNLNLLKYCASIIAVLDWWLNDKNSPAYAQDATVLFRQDSTGKPSFNVEVVRNVNELFAETLKQKMSMQRGPEEN